MMAGWKVGEAEAIRLMGQFVHGAGLRMYEKRRSRADMPETVSRLSPYLRFGHLSPRVLYYAVLESGLGREITKTFARRLHWRDLAVTSHNTVHSRATDTCFLLSVLSIDELSKHVDTANQGALRWYNR